MKFLMMGGFLCLGNIIFMIGIDDDCVDEVLVMIKEMSYVWEQFMILLVNLDVMMDGVVVYLVEV